MLYENIRNHVVNTRAFGVKVVEFSDCTPAGCSTGIRNLIEGEPNAFAEIEKCIQKFYEADFGTFYDDADWETIIPTYWMDRNAYGEYEITTLDAPIYIHYEPVGMSYNLVIYLDFER